MKNNNTIFAAAHALTRDTLATNPGYNYRATFAAALRIVWAQANPAAAAVKHANAIRAEWDALTPEQQLEFCARCVNRASRDIIGMSEGGTDDDPAYNAMWEKTAFGNFRELGEYHNETWMRVAAHLQRLEEATEKRISDGKQPRSLAFIVYNAAKAAVMAIYRAEQKHGVASVRERSDDEGNTESYVESACSSRDNTAAEAIRSLDFEAFSARLDDIDKKIFDGIKRGASLDALADTLPIKRGAVNRRRQKIVEKLRDYLTD